MKRWSAAGATTLRKNQRFSFRVKPPLGKTAYRAVAQRKGKAPKASSKALRLTGLPAATSTLTVGAGGSVALGGLLPTPVKRKVFLQRRSGGGWSGVESTFSSAKGQVSFRFRVTATTRLRLYAPKLVVRAKKGGKGAKKKGSKSKRRIAASASKTKIVASYPPFTSPPVEVRVEDEGADPSAVAPPSVALTMPSDLCANQRVDATVQVSPPSPGAAVEVQYSTDDGASWTAIGSGAESAAGAAVVAFAAPPTPDTYAFRAVVAGAGSAPQPVEVRICQGFDPLPQVAGGEGHSCALDRHGEAWCWGRNTYGEVGDGSKEERLEAVRVAGGHVFAALALGFSHSCALADGGKVWCWGFNTGNKPIGFGGGALGDGTLQNRDAPVPVSGGHTFVELVAGSHHTCGLVASGAVYCWGDNYSGQIGDGTEGINAYKTVPTRAQGGTFDTIEASGNYTCGLVGGRAYCWGSGYGTAPAAVPTGGAPPFASLFGGGGGMCALTATGAAWCWGYDTYGQLGQGVDAWEEFHAGSKIPLPVHGGHTFERLDGGSRHFCGITTAGPTLCWGYNNFGPLGQGSSDLDAHPEPEAVADHHTFTRLGLGAGHSCAADQGGIVWCWGYNAKGQLGTGEEGIETSRYVPIPVFDPGP